MIFPPQGPLEASAAVYSYTASVSDTVNQSSVTHSAVAIGAAASDRIVVVVINSRLAVVSSMTIGGVSTTQALSAGDGESTTAIRYAAVPTGTTADIAITFNTTATANYLRVYKVTGWKQQAPFETGVSSGTGSTQSNTLVAATDGVTIAAASTPNVNSWTWTGSDQLTERWDQATESNDIRWSGADGYGGRYVEAVAGTSTGATKSLIMAHWR